MSDVEIGKIGEYRVYMSFKEIKKIANKEVSRRLKKATEALKFYAEKSNYRGYQGLSKVFEDCGDLAYETLQEIGE